MAKDTNPVAGYMASKGDKVGSFLTDPFYSIKQEAAQTGNWGKPYGEKKSAWDVLGAGGLGGTHGILGKNNPLGDPDNPRDRTIGRTVGTIISLGLASDAAGASAAGEGGAEGAGGVSTAGGASSGAGATAGAGGISTAAGTTGGGLSLSESATLLSAASAVYNATKPTDKGPTSPDATPPPTLPTSISYDTQRSSLSEQLLRRGRASTILTSNSLGA